MSIKVISGHAIFNENMLVLSKKFNWILEKDFNPQPNDLYIVFGAHELAHPLLELQIRKNMSFGYVIFNSEQPNSQFFKNKYYIQLMKKNIVFDYNTISANYLDLHFNIKVLSYFYFEFMKFTLDVPRVYDVAFIGSRSDKRAEILQQLQLDYPDLKFYIDYNWSHGSAESLTQILHQCKTVLNIPYYDNNPLETHRIHKALACGCKVVSYYSNESDANEFYKDYVTMTDRITLEERPPLKSYEELVSVLAKKFNPHMNFMLEHIHKKLLSLSNEVSQPADLHSNDEKEEIVLGEQVWKRLPLCEMDPTRPVRKVYDTFICVKNS